MTSGKVLLRFFLGQQKGLRCSISTLQPSPALDNPKTTAPVRVNPPYGCRWLRHEMPKVTCKASRTIPTVFFQVCLNSEAGIQTNTSLNRKFAVGKGAGCLPKTLHFAQSFKGEGFCQVILQSLSSITCLSCEWAPTCAFMTGAAD